MGIGRNMVGVGTYLFTGVGDIAYIGKIVSDFQEFDRT
jgi:hypothetical protein